MATKYVSTSGSNGNPGTITEPWATWHYGFNNIAAGDTLYIRGGTYQPASTSGSGSGGTIYTGVYISGKDGTSGSKYQVFNYPGEIPILDGTNITNTGRRAGILLNGCNYWHIKGLVIRNIAQYSSGAYSSQGMQVNSGNNNLIENCVAYSNGGPGFRIRTPDGHDNTFLNCDSYSNYDPYTATDGDDADGFDIGFGSSNYRIRLTGCRAWDNGDDGFDMYQGSGYSGIYYLTNCWAWKNGYIPGTGTSAGQGCGFKLGDDGQTYTGVTKRFLYNCIAYDNRTRGFSQESANVKKEFYNCIAYSNNTHGFSFWNLDIPDILRNNVSWGNTSSNIEHLGTDRISDHNSWDGGVTVTDADYVNIDGTELELARQSDGNLPIMEFLHLVTGSDLRGAGDDTDIYPTDGDGQSWDSPPSLGAFEFGTSAPPVSILVTSITVTGAGNEIQIATQSGTLQMYANVLPVDADNDNVTWSVANGTGIATINIYGLLAAVSNGTVTVIATAQDGSGIYGSLEITIVNQVIPVGTGLKDRDGNLYTTIVIGLQEWTVENLRTTHYADGSAIQNLTDCVNAYGALYNWFAATYSTGGASIAPSGWHVPTRAEFDILQTLYGGEFIAGIHLKEAGLTHWNAPNADVDNSSGFTALGSGYRTTAGEFLLKKIQTAFRSSTGTELCLFMRSDDDNASNPGDYDEEQGWPIRLIKDDVIDPGTVTDIDGNVYPTISIGGASDWFLPSHDELLAMYTELYLYSVGGLEGGGYWTSSETALAATNAWVYALNTAAWVFVDKTTSLYGVRACRSFAGILGDYNLRDMGPGGGYIFAFEGGLYYEAAPEDQMDLITGCNWSNIGTAIGATAQGTDIGTGQANTTAILGQAGHTSSAAKLCDDYISTGQVWMAENLKVTHYNDGTDIPIVTDDATWAADTDGAMCWYNNEAEGWGSDTDGAYCWYDNDIAYKSPYGALYNWYAVSNVHELAYLERNGITQTGWRVPTYADWSELVTYLDVALSGGKLKEIGTTHWTTPNTGATNESGFTALGSGLRLADCTFSELSETNNLAVSDETIAGQATDFRISYNSANSEFIVLGANTENIGYSVRLVRDTSSIPPDPPDLPVPPTYPETVPYNYGAIPVYRFYVTESPSSFTYEVFPLKFLSTTINSERVGDSIFYRNKFNGSLLFGTNSLVLDSSSVQHNRREDWDLFWGFENHDPSARIDLIITQEWGGVINIYWEGYFSSSDGNFDIDACTFDVTPHLEDDYTEVLDKVEVQHNILSSGLAVSTTAVFSDATVIFTRNRWLMDVIDYLGTDATFGILPGAIISSDFFTEDPNYVTQNVSHLLYLTIAQKSDILRPTSTNPATTALMSWNNLMDILWTIFQVKWNYDPLINTINIEHISWFGRIAGLDLRTQMSMQMTNKYSYIKEKMPKYEKFYWMEADNDNFVGTPIWYDSLFVNQNPDENSSELAINVTTDLEFIHFNGEAIADDGFVILCNYLDTGVYYVEFENGMIEDEVKLNMHLSWANLHHYYFRYERVLIQGYMNDTLTTFVTARKTKKQPCTAIICPDSEYDPSDEITTELGETYFGGVKAIVDKSQLSPTGEIKFELLYGPPDNEDTGIPAGKFIRIYQGPDTDEKGCCHFHAILSEAADADLDILIQWSIFDYYDSEVCDQTGIGEGVTWTIPMGSLTDDYDLVFEGCDCDEVSPTSYIIFESHNWKVVGDPTWIVSFFYDPECERGG